MHPQNSKNYSVATPFVLLAVLLIFNAWFLYWNAFRCFNFYDMSFNLDGGWRVAVGQRPYADFLYFSGPVHLYINALFFKIFGFSKFAVWWHLVVVHSLVMGFIFFMIYRRLPQWLTAGITILTMTSFYWPISHPWHNQTAYLWGIIALVLLVDYLWSSKKLSAFWLGIIAGFCVALSILTKVNIGIAFLGFFAAMFLVLDERWKLWSAYLGGILIAGLISFGLVNIPAYWQQAEAMYTTVQSGRLVNLFVPVHWLANYYWIPLMIALANLVPLWRTSKEWIVLVVGFYVVAIFTIFTGNIIPQADIFLWGIYMAVIFLVMFRIRSSQKIWKISMGLLSLVLMGMIILSIRFGLELKVWQYSKYSQPGNYAIKAKGLRGWQCYRKIGEVLDTMVEFIQTSVPPNESLLVLTDLQILYGLTNHAPYKGIPIMVMEENLIPAPGAQREQVTRAIKNNLPDWIIIDFVTFQKIVPYLELDQVLKRKYDVSQSLGYYFILRKKDTGDKQ